MTTKEKLSEIDAKIKKLEEKKAIIDRAESARISKLTTRVKIIIGGYYLAESKKNDELKKKLIGALDKAELRKQDKETLKAYFT